MSKKPKFRGVEIKTEPFKDGDAEVYLTKAVCGKCVAPLVGEYNTKTKTYFFRHEDSYCEYSGKLYRMPSVELKEIEPGTVEYESIELEEVEQ